MIAEFKRGQHVRITVGGKTPTPETYTGKVSRVQKDGADMTGPADWLYWVKPDPAYRSWGRGACVTSKWLELL